MKVFTFYYNRYQNATTSKELKKNDIDHYVMLHNHEDYEKFKKFDTIQGKPIITNQSKGLAYQRNYALSMMQEGEWAAFMCDDFIKIKSYPINVIQSNLEHLPVDTTNQKYFGFYSKSAKHVQEFSLKQMFKLFPFLIEKAESKKIHLIGFALHTNPLNLRNKFIYRGLADGRFWLIKKSNYQFDEKAQLIDDVAWTAENLIRHNNVLVLNWTIPYFGRYTAGGFGSTVERKVQRKKECQYLCMKYHPLVRLAKKANWDYGTHIKLFGSQNNINISKRRNNL